MEKLNIGVLGALYAFGAAALNGSIGVISKVLIALGLGASSIALVKTVIGCIILTMLLPFLRNLGAKVGWWQAALCSFLGIFTLFYFETAAYQHDLAANVVVILMAFASISALLFSWPILGERPKLAQWVGFLCAIFGVSMIAGMHSFSSIQGSLLAAIAGSGYGLFSVMMKKMKIEGGLVFTRQLLFYGAIFLFFPAYSNGFEPELLQKQVLIALVALAILPTILGFYCTTKAIQLLPPAQVQILELSEPLFAMLLAFIFLQEVPGLESYLGGAFIICGLAVSSGVLKAPTFSMKKA